MSCQSNVIYVLDLVKWLLKSSYLGRLCLLRCSHENMVGKYCHFTSPAAKVMLI